jgi:hypothetical protein
VRVVALIEDLEYLVDEFRGGDLYRIEDEDADFLQVLGGDGLEVEDVHAEEVKVYLGRDLLIEHLIEVVVGV